MVTQCAGKCDTCLVNDAAVDVVDLATTRVDGGTTTFAGGSISSGACLARAMVSNTAAANRAFTDQPPLELDAAVLISGSTGALPAAAKRRRLRGLQSSC